MTTPAPPLVLDWHLWAPPLNPPTTGGLDAAWAQQVVDYTDDPHLAAAIQWEAYAGTLMPTPAVGSVATGAQSVSYNPATPTGAYGQAIQMAAWHRSFVRVDTIPMAKDVTAVPVQQPWWVLYGQYPPNYNAPFPQGLP